MINQNNKYLFYYKYTKSETVATLVNVNVCNKSYITEIAATQSLCISISIYYQTQPT